MEYDSFIRWLEEVPLYGHKDGTRNMEKLMARMGHPEREAKVIHVAGTNGKGSICAMIASVLRESGLKVGLYTSPHLVSYTERIQVDGVQIPKTDLARIGTKVKEEIGKMVAEGENHCTFFEILTAIGFLYFAEQKVDAIVLEVGVGGRLDATNIIDDPALCVIASISLDHTKVLGDTLEAIAGEKAGILRASCPVVLAENPLCVQEVVKQKASQIPCGYLYAPDFDVAADTYEIPLVGDYQVQNKQAALVSLRYLQEHGFPITEESLREGLKKTAWPGRMQRLSFEGQELLLDGAHNPAGASMLVQYLRRTFEKDSIVLVFSALGKKDVRGILSPLRDCAAVREAVFTCIDGENNTEQFVSIWSESGKPCRVVEKPIEAVREAGRLQAAQGDGKPSGARALTVCAGSLYLLGELLPDLEKQA